MFWLFKTTVSLRPIFRVLTIYVLVNQKITVIMHYYWYGFLFSFNNVHSLVQGTGEYEKLTQGLFENFLDCKFKDPHMDGVSCVKQVSGSNR